MKRTNHASACENSATKESNDQTLQIVMVFGTIFAGRAALCLFEQAVKGSNAREAGHESDLCDGIFRVSQKYFCLFDAPVVQVIAEGKACVLFKKSGKMKFTEA